MNTSVHAAPPPAVRAAVHDAVVHAALPAALAVVAAVHHVISVALVHAALAAASSGLVRIRGR